MHYKSKNLAEESRHTVSLMHVRVQFNLFLWKALTEAMANIKLDKNVIVCFIVAGESRLLVVLQFSFFFAVRFSCEKRTLLLMLNFNNCCLSLGRFTWVFTAYSL